ncbi:MAG: DUF1127 domain-containing protein [Methylocystaceae bacterium]|nr:DUF1127 domain-containing protein [Methylocystaceae bacterium]
MTAVTLNHMPAGHNTGSGFKAPKNFFNMLIKAIVSGIKQELAARKAIRELSALTNAQLHDIGLTRSEIEHAARCGR